MQRRNFIQKSFLATVGTMWVPTFLKAFENPNDTTQNPFFKPNFNEKICIIIQFSGGNDGLNTLVPFKNDAYYKNRPLIQIVPNEVLKINDELGFNPALPVMKTLHENGELAILNNVGYPEPDRSHFRSMDIWLTASKSSQYLQTGWIGRYLDNMCQNDDCKLAYEAIEVDDSLGLALKGDKVKGLAVKDAQKLYQIAKNQQLQQATNTHANEHNHDLASYLYKTLAETQSSAQYLHEKTTKKPSQTYNYPNTDLGKQLKTIADFVKAGVSTNVYYASHGSFDTHVNQKAQQARLLTVYNDAIDALVKDLKANNLWKNVVLMTFSEFGRRVAQNGSQGTDHGTASNVYLMGGSLKKAGVLNELPNLTDLDEGDLKFTMDFRRIYATILDKHLDTDHKKILNEKFDVLNFL